MGGGVECPPNQKKEEVEWGENCISIPKDYMIIQANEKVPQDKVVRGSKNKCLLFKGAWETMC
jgi:hypothetical protein